jgi:hypothetical protein
VDNFPSRQRISNKVPRRTKKKKAGKEEKMSIKWSWGCMKRADGRGYRKRRHWNRYRRSIGRG